MERPEAGSDSEAEEDGGQGRKGREGLHVSTASVARDFVGSAYLFAVVCADGTAVAAELVRELRREHLADRVAKERDDDLAALAAYRALGVGGQQGAAQRRGASVCRGARRNGAE